MAEHSAPLTGPDLLRGVALTELPDGGRLVGHVGDEEVLLVRRGTEVFAVGAHCQHYHGPLVDGLVVDDTVRCPWHHACFDLRTGEALRAPAFNPLPCWSVEQRDGRVFVGDKRQPAKPGAREQPQKIVIVGGGAAGFAAAELLRRRQYRGSLIMLSQDEAAPVDRPNLSKDYLAGEASEDWLPLSPEEFYRDNQIDLRLKTKVTRIDTRSREVLLAGGSRIAYDRLLLATGAEPIRLTIPGAELPHVATLRSLADCQKIIARAKSSHRAIVLGASFIGLEVAAALRTRGLEVHVVAPERVPMERILGPQLGEAVRVLHERHGVVFHLEDQASSIDSKRVTLRSGGALETDMVVAGIGVRPCIDLAQAAQLTIDRGVLVNSFLETSEPGVFAAGDIARWPDLHSGETMRVEHWVVAERQGQTAARNMLGDAEPFTAVPFFWSQHYDLRINYAGHAEKWDQIDVDGDIAAHDCVLRFKRDGRILAAVSLSRDLASLQAELAMEQRDSVTTR
jgi:NADPH-dependent 2,4-dienoyl-CoA reductase/sulfur reductase-like enzyme/nitrite reductase/ring-hydroxylating ferredoxin subunit